MPPWGSSLHAYLTTYACYCLSQIGFVLRNSPLLVSVPCRLLSKTVKGKTHPTHMGYGIEGLKHLPPAGCLLRPFPEGTEAHLQTQRDNNLLKEVRLIIVDMLDGSPCSDQQRKAPLTQPQR